MLLGGAHGIVESRYRRYRDQGKSDEAAFQHSVDSLTGPISRIISKDGLDGVNNRLTSEDRKKFSRAYSVSHPIGMELTQEIYDEVESGNEIRGVVMAGQWLARFPMGKIGQAAMWQVGQKVRADRVDLEGPLDPFTAGVHRRDDGQVDARQRFSHRGGGFAQPIRARARSGLHGG